MSIESEVTVGTVVVVKVGRNEVKVTVTEITDHGWKVKSQSTGREFEVRHIERIVTEPTEEPETAEPVESETEPEEEPEAAQIEPEAPETDDEEDPAVNPAPESGSGPRPRKKHSLLNAAAQVLAACRTPMTCKEMVAKAIEMGLWTPTGGKTPQQTLYSGISREIKTAEQPRFKKSQFYRGSFEYAKER